MGTQATQSAKSTETTQGAADDADVMVLDESSSSSSSVSTSTSASASASALAASDAAFARWLKNSPQEDESDENDSDKDGSDVFDLTLSPSSSTFTSQTSSKLKNRFSHLAECTESEAKELVAGIDDDHLSPWKMM